MIGVEMGGDQPGEATPPQRPVDERLPGGPRRRVVDAGVDQRQARAVFDKVQVDVVEPKRQREPRPEHSGPDFDDLAGLWRLGTGKLERFRQDVGRHRVSLFPLAPRQRGEGPGDGLW